MCYMINSHNWFKAVKKCIIDPNRSKLISLHLLFSSGHIGITVDDTYKACERFERLGVEFVKKPDDGKSIFMVVFVASQFS